MSSRHYEKVLESYLQMMGVSLVRIQGEIYLYARGARLRRSIVSVSGDDESAVLTREAPADEETGATQLIKLSDLAAYLARETEDGRDEMW